MTPLVLELGGAGLALLFLLVALRVRRHRRIWLAAFLEQGRREHGHPVEYRVDQRIHAIQQRLSRHLGARAFSERARRRIVRHLGLAQ